MEEVLFIKMEKWQDRIFRQETHIVPIDGFSIDTVGAHCYPRDTVRTQPIEEKNREIMQEDGQRRIILPRFVQIRAADLVGPVIRRPGAHRIIERWEELF